MYLTVVQVDESLQNLDENPQNKIEEK